PETGLSEAQNVLAKEYGFGSWPRLKVFVESRSVSQPADEQSKPQKNGHPFAGSWTANISRSKRHPLHQVQSVDLKLVLAGDAITIAQRVVDEWGKETRATMTVQADGQEHDLGNGHLVLSTWVRPNLLQTIGKKDGETTGCSTLEISDDERTLTFSARLGSEREFSQVLIFDRARGGGDLSSADDTDQ